MVLFLPDCWLGFFWHVCQGIAIWREYFAVPPFDLDELIAMGDDLEMMIGEGLVKQVSSYHALNLGVLRNQTVFWQRLPCRSR
jgi:hypothetical protein